MLRRAPLLLLAAIGCGEAPGAGDAALAYRQAGTFAVGEHPVTLAAFDADGDGDVDLLVPGLVAPTLTLLQNRGGALEASEPAPLPGGALSAAAADLEGDGAVELVLSIPSAGQVGLWRLEGGAPTPVATAWRDEPSAVATRDVDGDGRAELAIAEAGAVSLVTGEAGALRELGSFAAPRWPTSLALADVDGDGRAELAVTGASPGELWLAGDGEPQRLELGSWPMGLIAADLDADPEPELVGADNLGDALLVIDAGDAGLTVRRLPAPGQPAAVAAGDLDGDGAADLAVALKGADRVELWRGDGRGGFEPSASVAAGWGPTALALADLDGDGCLDVAIVNAFSNDVTIHRCQRPLSGPR